MGNRDGLNPGKIGPSNEEKMPFFLGKMHLCVTVMNVNPLEI